MPYILEKEISNFQLYHDELTGAYLLKDLYTEKYLDMRGDDADYFADYYNGLKVAWGQDDMEPIYQELFYVYSAHVRSDIKK